MRERGADLLEDVGNLLLVKTETSLEDVVGLGDELHVSVLDTVVDHLDVVTRSSLTNPITTRLSLGLSSGLLWYRQLTIPDQLIADLRKISLMWGQAASEPPGMREGPFRAPSSPPETPEPTKSKPFFSSS